MRQLKNKNNANAFEIIVTIIAILWIVFIISYILPIKHYGILPRDITGLAGILFSPFIHGNLIHLITNTISLFVSGLIFISLERKRSILIVIHIILWGGFGTWLIGRSGTVHIGASGVIYGILGYLFLTGFFNRNLKTILVSLITFFLYGGTIRGILPGMPFVSWEGHLCGLVTGIFLAWRYAKK